LAHSKQSLSFFLVLYLQTDRAPFLPPNAPPNGVSPSESIGLFGPLSTLRCHCVFLSWPPKRPDNWKQLVVATRDSAKSVKLWLFKHPLKAYHPKLCLLLVLMVSLGLFAPEAQRVSRRLFLVLCFVDLAPQNKLFLLLQLGSQARRTNRDSLRARRARRARKAS